MNNLAQVIGPIFGRRGSGVIFIPCFLLLSSCGPENVSAPTPPVQTTQVVPDSPPPPDFGDIPGHPLADWTYADNLEELHAIWTARFGLSATPDLNPKTIWPYADAVMLDGASWGLSAETSRLIYIKTDGHAYQRSGAAHPRPDEMAPETPLTPGALAASGWAEAQTSPDLQRSDEGSGFRAAGPIRATESCLACHGYAPDQVVALLVYDFQEIPDD